MNKILLFLIIILAFANSVKTFSKNDFEEDAENLSNKAVLKIRHHLPQPQQTGGSAPEPNTPNPNANPSNPSNPNANPSNPNPIAGTPTPNPAGGTSIPNPTAGTISQASANALSQTSLNSPSSNHPTSLATPPTLSNTVSFTVSPFVIEHYLNVFEIDHAVNI
ncbi:8306_t:CDS:2 [Racocetra fulgida]|uniref:8306_t:CDS:1 n=1 Tax=Racocetra fulgida TaxID=60492 RepID=A0A9N8WLQ7_9GLOM|nr:8306_t:CDS:2 [Racocetra fulgida]